MYKPRVVSDDEDHGWMDQNENKIQAPGTHDTNFDHIPQDASAKFLRWHH